MTVAVEPGRVPQWTIGDRLRKAREDAGLDQGQLAEAMEVSRKTIGNNETGRVQPRRIVVRAWALATGVSFDWLWDGTTPSPGMEQPRDLEDRGAGQEAPPVGLEPTTCRLTVGCSAN